MKFLGAICILFAGAATVGAEDFDIQSFGGNGQVVFSTSTNEQWYSVEWAASLEGPWTDTWQNLTYIPSAGSGLATAAVPMFYRVVGHLAPTNMILVPAGTFDMGDALNDGYSEELPVHSVTIDGFFMDRFEVTQTLWNEVRAWAITNGYTFDDDQSSAKGPDCPITSVNWYNAVKWCNARSQMEGLAPAYFTDAAHSLLYVGDFNNLSNACVDWDANGYRLPTEAEWEKAARGGATGYRFPWTDWTNCISFAKANYYGWSTYPYDLEDGNHPVFGGEAAPAGYFEPNGYGLYDMAGNASEWCWDVYRSDYYATSPADNPRGPDASGSSAVLRGGSYNDLGASARCAKRTSDGKDHASDVDNTGGFRCVRRQ